MVDSRRMLFQIPEAAMTGREKAERYVWVSIPWSHPAEPTVAASTASTTGPGYSVGTQVRETCTLAVEAETGAVWELLFTPPAPYTATDRCDARSPPPVTYAAVEGTPPVVVRRL